MIKFRTDNTILRPLNHALLTYDERSVTGMSFRIPEVLPISDEPVSSIDDILDEILTEDPTWEEWVAATEELRYKEDNESSIEFIDVELA